MKFVLRTVLAGFLCIGALLSTGLSVSAAPPNSVATRINANDPRNLHSTAAQTAQAKLKDARAQAWVQNQQTIAPYCVADPTTGQCVQDSPVSIGGQWVTEPTDQLDWCGPGAGEAAYLHWNSSAVYNHANITVANEYGGQTTYTGASGLAWMADFAVVFPVDGQSGVMKNGGTAATTLRDGMNKVTGTSYYVYYNPPNQADMMGNVEYDIGHDGHPMIYLANTNYLATWKSGLNINHYVEGYGYDITPYYPQTAWYADTAAHTDAQQNVPGDYKISQSQMWQAVSHAYYTDSSGTHYIAVIIM